MGRRLSPVMHCFPRPSGFCTIVKNPRFTHESGRMSGGRREDARRMLGRGLAAAPLQPLHTTTAFIRTRGVSSPRPWANLSPFEAIALHPNRSDCLSSGHIAIMRNPLYQRRNAAIGSLSCQLSWNASGSGGPDRHSTRNQLP